MHYGKEYTIATINIRGAKRIGAREEVEEWTKNNKIDIANILETRVGVNSREARKGYTWYFSGENQHVKDDTAGVAIVVTNEMVKFSIDIEPISDRTMWATWHGTK